MTACPCGSGETLAKCCEPYIKGTLMPPTAEALMRARYTAHTQGDMGFLVTSHAQDTRGDIDIESTRRWAERCEWLGLEITATEQGQAGDSEGVVEFIAHYRDRDQRQQHRERALFDFVDGCWLYRDAETPEIETARRAQPKIGRNEPCPCGSGRKYKKCCGKAA